MSISRYVFSNTDTAANLEELYAYFLNNAGDYFTDITLADNTLTLRTEGGSVTVTTSQITVTASGGGKQSTNMYTSAAYFKYGYRTGSGILLTGSAGNFIAVSRTNTGSTFFMTRGSGGGTYCIWADMSVGTAIGTTFYANQATESSMTTLTPMVTNGGTYSEGLYFTYFTQYPPVGGNNYYNSPGIISVGGTQYAYNGIIAVKE